MKPILPSMEKYTSEDWYGHYAGYAGDMDGDYGEVHVMLAPTGPNHPTCGRWEVVVWGHDDISMVKCFMGWNKAWRCYQDVIALADVTRCALISRRFIHGMKREWNNANNYT